MGEDKKADHSSFLTLVAVIAGAMAVFSYVDASSREIGADYTVAVAAGAVALAAALGAIASRLGSRKGD